jgi:plastocyanin
MRARRPLTSCLILACGMSAVPAGAETIKVVIDKLVFAPEDIKAKVGDTIEWTNTDILAHTATLKGSWDVMIPPKKSASVVLRTAGTFEYYCRFHPNMKGRIVVSAADARTN